LYLGLAVGSSTVRIMPALLNTSSSSKVIKKTIKHHSWHVIPSKTYRKHSAKPVRISKALAPHIFQVIEFSPPRSFQSARPTGRSETHLGRDRGRCRGCLLVFGSLRLPIQEANVVGHQAGLGLPEGGGIVFSGTSAKRLGANLDTESRS
jgi:hypothetical protein